MIIPDVNLLLYAEIDAYPQHDAARIWWEDSLSKDLRVALPALLIFGFLRIATRRRIFEEPLALSDALARVETWLERSNVMFLGPGPRHLETAFQLLRALGTGGNLTTDVRLAASPSRTRPSSARTIWTSAASPACVGRIRSLRASG